VRANSRRLRSPALPLGILLLAGVLVLAVGAPGPGALSRATGQTGAEEPTPQSDDSLPASRVTMIGSSPAEAPDETWGVGVTNQASVLLRYTSESGWSLGPGLLNSAGLRLSGFKLDQPTGLTAPSPLAGQVTPTGAGVLIGTVASPAGPSEQVVLVRNPGGAFQETTPVPTEGEGALLGEEESLFSGTRAPLLVALDEGGGHAGAFVVPVNGSEDGVLHWNGKQWTREPIEVPKASVEVGGFRVLAIEASSPTNAWLLARLTSQSGGVALFRRELGEGGEPPVWRPVALAGGQAGEPLTVDGGPFSVGEQVSALQSQVLTVSSQGVWIDGERAGASTTIFFIPEHEGNSGQVSASWCEASCTYSLPQPLPTGPSRSFAWANSSSTYGERVITGLPDGVTLRLDGTSFTRVLALGGSVAPADVGGTFGAAFSEAREGWLGQEALPVHLTLHPAGSRLAPWPVSFRHALLAIAPQPGAPVGALTSEALAVGDLGEVARYKPGQGWLPESLLGPGGRYERPRLHAVAWPTPARAYAVGYEEQRDEGQMWLWRGETGLWERDPATPPNFRGNLLAIAFDPANPAVGYAVGQSGLLLRFGKTWTQEALPPQAEGASFTSIAFAGSEAIVAYRKLLNPNKDDYAGGLLINEGSGWQVDQGAAAAMGANVPWAVAGLPDGGAAFVASGVGQGSQIYERNGPGDQWEPTPTPFPGAGAPGSLALFREGGALRVVATGKAVDTYPVESVEPSPPGFPPPLIAPYPLESNTEKGVLRQTASGWSDEEHDLNDVREPAGEYTHYDTVFQPDPIFAVLIGPTGTEGWAVGGFAEASKHGGVLDTADVDRYPAEAGTPPGVASAPIASEPADATFAIGGGARCAAPCADLARAGIGPDVWLEAALARAGAIGGVRAFLYTGPRVAGALETQGTPPPFPYAQEQNRYAAVLGSSPIPAFAAVTPSDLDGEGGECTFEAAFGGFSEPFGKQPPSVASGLTPVSRSSQPCSTGSQSSYYAFNSSGAGGAVRVIVLDNSKDVGQAQLEWLEAELENAKLVAQEPAIVIGNAYLQAQIAAGDGAALNVARALVSDGASAYFYDAPEENLALPLQVGSESIPTFGSGTLGYVNYEGERSGAFLGASGFLLGQVDAGARNPTTNRAPVSARLIPNIGELALEAQDGTLLRRSEVGFFDALARRPRAGNRAHNQSTEFETDPYIPIPSNCVGTTCANGLFPEYTFSSSRTDIGNFVEPNLAVAGGTTVLLGANGEPIPDPASGLFCAFNAGTTIVTISAGGLSSSLPVTVQAGSVRRPCGTVPLKELPVHQQAAPAVPPAPAPAPAPAGVAPTPAPVVPLPPVPSPVTPAPVRRPAAAPYFVPPALETSLVPFLPPPVPTPARPTPPSGTSAVTSPVEAPEREEEEEGATESVSNQALAYSAPEHEPSPDYILGIVVLAALAGASVRRRPRRGGREVRVAPATLSTMRAQRRMSSRRRGD
jgi:hypothetical protein